MGVASCLSVIRGSFQRTSAVGSMKFVRCPESINSTIVILIGATLGVLYREVVRWWEGPVWEVPQYNHTVILIITCMHVWLNG